MIIANKYEVPDNCPKNCLFKQEYGYQGGLCHRCPIFNCRKDVDGFCLIEPEDYREDWAKEWSKFFETGEVPELRFKMEK